METNSRVHLRLDTISSDERVQFNYLKLVAITYRANHTTLSKLFQIDELEIFDKLIAFNAEEEDRHAIRFLCSKDKSDQNIAYKKVLHFHLKLQTALRENDEETKDKLLNIINHRLELALMQKSRNGETLTSKEFEVVVGFHYRFAKTYERMAGLIGRELSTYEKRINKLFETNPTFEEKIRDVTEFNKDLRDRNWKDSIRKGKK